MARKRVNTWYNNPDLGPAGHARGGRIEIGIVAPSYGLEHVSFMLDVPRYQHVLLRRFPLHKFERGGSFWETTPVLLRGSVPLVHTFNMLPLNGPPFLTTFEAELPFYLGRERAWQHNTGHRLMASGRCRGLLSLSEVAAENARRKFRALGRDDIVEKISVFRGGVVPAKGLRQGYSSSDQPLKVLFVGGDGLRKGLIPLLDAISDASDQGARIELTVVSSLPSTSYALEHTDATVEDIHRRIAASDNVRHIPSLPYDDVRAEMARHDVLALPTLDETLGWVVIEAAMEGMCAVTSNVFAMPELVEDGVTGRVVALPLREDFRWVGIGAHAKQAHWDTARNILRTGLGEVFLKLSTDRNTVRKWGEAAQKKMRGLYSTDDAAERLSALYSQAIGH